MTLALAIDLGGTKIEAALVDDDGAIVEGSRRRTPTGAGAASDVTVLSRGLAEVIDGCRAHPRWSEVAAAGIGAAGPIDLAAGTIAPINLPAAHGFGIVEAVRAASGLDGVTLRLDGTCIALAEAWRGAARGVRNAIVFVVSTGVGGGILSDGRLVAGGSGNAGHLGQMLVADIDGAPAASTLEQRASGPHTVAWAQERGWTGSTGEELASAYRDGDRIARAAVARSAHAVGIGLTSAATLLDLELAVVGGGFSFVADDYPHQIEEVVRASAINGYAARLPVVRAGLGGDAPLIGAAALVHRADLL
ncbi:MULTISPECIES: ROK family protein [Microbacterium]|uniref:ROK family protein n=1 Tax=Microbacterium TaxID=33882 RepID=UPI00168AC298|nr:MULTISPECIES: ROK family protein [Microbacterium]QOC24359.1 ROK family protein [Microbacterium hominis]QYF96360.1 ROK family protein [Microbacterium sp. PAMC21962]